MASEQEAQNAILDAAEKLAQQAGAANHHAVALKWAAAVNQLAEAHAWLETARQPHGGGISISD